MNTLEVSKTKSDRVARTFLPIKASASTGDLPTKIEILKTGIWDTPNHGIFAITAEDLVQYKTNFDAQVAQVGDTGITIDYDHNDGIAAGWVKAFTIEGDTLYADNITWSAQGQEDLKGLNYRFISPEFYPASRGGWEDPEQYGIYVPNVVAAISLVNRPLFKGLKPIMASANSSNKEKIYISASAKENAMPTLEDVRGKKAADLDDSEKAFVAENKDQFTAEEQTNLGLEVTAKPADVVVPAPAEPVVVENKNEEENVSVAPEMAAVAASIKAGESVVIKASEHKLLMDTANEYQNDKAKRIVASHVARGAVKPEAAEGWVNRLTASSGKNREDLESALTELPDHPVLASQQGSVENAGDATGDAWTKIEASAKKIVADSKGETSFTDAVKQAKRDNPEVAKQLIEERAA